MTVIPIAEWAPDQPDLSSATSLATNVIALTPQSYGPLPALQEYSSNALLQPCIGMGFAEDSSPATHTFGGTTAHLEVLNQGSTTWGDVSGSTYTAAAGESWRFAQYNNLMLATDWTDPIQSYNMISGGTFSELSSAAPNARFIAIAKTFAIVANTYDSVGGDNPARIWWSSAGDPTTWPTPGSSTAQQDQSDYSDLNGPQGKITGLAPNLSGCDCAVFFERGVFNMFYAGPPDVFNFYPAMNVKGCIAPNSIVQRGSLVDYYGEDGFYTYDGNQATPIGANKVDKWFASVVDQSALNLIVGAPGIQNKASIWIFRSIYAPTAMQDTMLIYRWDIQRWTMGIMQSQWITRVAVTETSASVPLLQGQLELGAIDGSQFLAFFNGAPLAAQAGTQLVQINPRGLTFVNVTRPLINSVNTGLSLLLENNKVILLENNTPLLLENSAATFTIAVSARQNYSDSEVFGPDIAPNIMGECPQRAPGRYHRGRLTVPSGLWTEMFGIDVSGIPAGLR